MMIKPEFCVEVHTAEQHEIFYNLLTQYEHSCCFRGRYKENPDGMRAFISQMSMEPPLLLRRYMNMTHGNEQFIFPVLVMRKILTF